VTGASVGTRVGLAEGVIVRVNEGAIDDVVVGLLEGLWVGCKVGCGKGTTTVHTDEPVTDTWPDGHGVHTVAPAAEYVLAGQGPYVEEPTATQV